MRHATKTAMLLCWAAATAAAQYRPDAGLVLTPPPIPVEEAAADPAPAFAAAYVAAGRPRIALYWNRALDDETETVRVERETTRIGGNASARSSVQRTTGRPLPSLRAEADLRHSATRTVTRSIGPQRAPGRRARLSERDGTMIETAFQAEMARGGVQFVDRALSIRRTASTIHRAGGDPKLIEADALAGHADYLMEVLLVPDADAPLRHGFRVTMKNVGSGAQVLALYTRGEPPPSPAAAAAWVAGASGYELREPEQAPAPGADAVAAAAAREVMEQLASRLGRSR